MKIVFKSDDFAELNFVREYAEGFNVGGNSQIRESVSEMDYRGMHMRTHRIFCPGMIISMMKGSLEKDLVHILESDFPYLQMHFELNTTGCLYYPNAKFEVPAEIYGGSHALLFYPALNGRLNYLKKPDSYSVEIELSLDFLRKIFNNDLEVLRGFGNNIEKNHPAIMGNRSFPITLAMKHILVQIRDCKFAGTLKKLFIEAKVIELLTLQIEQIHALEANIKNLKRIDIDKLHEVRALLLANVHSLHSIEELSKTAGINRTKLQEGFKQLFGTTIFAFIAGIRLEEARQQILDSGGQASIAEIAAQSGYKNPQHFTVAFKRKFGSLPKDLKNN
ncbi:AraC family transcriptional regulator [Dyadobacter sp. LJ53]|uniref:helix-turn-helix domain-containing protein n=1 Tax=Dyadobacter chenwenxiniae TaxID=2906456 RepID=UPI001F23309B|nr:AraC family transcriptional regulator [Dyadobacter chenwenxiniae]MCF0050392.1 AraC family transcriptional regulator [Dyadobacter chenwenxiniae]